ARAEVEAAHRAARAGHGRLPAGRRRHRVLAMQWTGFVDDAGHFSLHRRREFSEWVKRFKGHEVVVTVQRKTRKRSLEQNAWLWGVALPLIAEHLGYDRHEHDDLHYDLLSVRFGTKAVAPRVPGA